MKRILLSCLLLASLFSTSVLTACHETTVGYLDTEYASFSTKELVVYRQVSDDDVHSLTHEYPAPWSSQRIQGVSGTNPVNFYFQSVTVSEGADAAAFNKAVQEGLVTVSGGTINLFPKAVATLPNGRYTVNLRVTNEGYSRELNGLFTFVVKDKAETTEDASADAPTDNASGASSDASTSTNTTVDNN